MNNTQQPHSIIIINGIYGNGCGAGRFYDMDKCEIVFEHLITTLDIHDVEIVILNSSVNSKELYLAITGRSESDGRLVPLDISEINAICAKLNNPIIPLRFEITRRALEQFGTVIKKYNPNRKESQMKSAGFMFTENQPSNDPGQSTFIMISGLKSPSHNGISYFNQSRADEVKNSLRKMFPSVDFRVVNNSDIHTACNRYILGPAQGFYWSVVAVAVKVTTPGLVKWRRLARFEACNLYKQIEQTYPGYFLWGPIPLDSRMIDQMIEGTFIEVEATAPQQCVVGVGKRYPVYLTDAQIKLLQGNGEDIDLPEDYESEPSISFSFEETNDIPVHQFLDGWVSRMITSCRVETPDQSNEQAKQPQQEEMVYLVITGEHITPHDADIMLSVLSIRYPEAKFETRTDEQQRGLIVATAIRVDDIIRPLNATLAEQLTAKIKAFNPHLAVFTTDSSLDKIGVKSRYYDELIVRVETLFYSLSADEKEIETGYIIDFNNVKIRFNLDTIEKMIRSLLKKYHQAALAGQSDADCSIIGSKIYTLLGVAEIALAGTEEARGYTANRLKDILQYFADTAVNKFA